MVRTTNQNPLLFTTEYWRRSVAIKVAIAFVMLLAFSEFFGSWETVSRMEKEVKENVPTLGMTALNLASLLCDEVSLAGFGYNVSQQGMPLHYYDHLPMSFMEQQKMHNVDRETQMLQKLVREGVITDLTGGIHCSFCTT